MAAKFLTIMCLVGACAAIPVSPEQHEASAPAHYEFSYSVHDQHSGDVKQQHESRQGDKLEGSYSLVQPDGVRRVVHYSADKHSGFNAQVSYEGHPTEAPAKVAYAPVTKVAYTAPVAKIVHSAPVVHAAQQSKLVYTAPVYHAAPVAKIAYSAPVVHAAPVYHAAPVAKVEYAAPAAKLYTESLGHVTFSSPYATYHH